MIKNTMTYTTIACVADTSKKAQQAKAKLIKRYGFVDTPKKADLIVVLGGDGFMLHSLHKYMDLDVPFYGMNCGTVGFLMNQYDQKDLLKCIESSKAVILSPLKMRAVAQNGKKHEAIAVNEVSLLRQTRQTAQLKITVDKSVRIQELTCDGALVATPAGSTAYNSSVHGPIIPIGSNLLALTPISPFRPRRWKGALLPHQSVVKIEVINPKKRPVSVVADFTEVRHVKTVEIREDRSKTMRLLFDPGQPLEERIVAEQFTL